MGRARRLRSRISGGTAGPGHHGPWNLPRRPQGDVRRGVGWTAVGRLPRRHRARDGQLPLLDRGAGRRHVHRRSDRRARRGAGSGSRYHRRRRCVRRPHRRRWRRAWPGHAGEDHRHQHLRHDAARSRRSWPPSPVCAASSPTRSCPACTVSRPAIGGGRHLQLVRATLAPAQYGTGAQLARADAEAAQLGPARVACSASTGTTATGPSSSIPCSREHGRDDAVDHARRVLPGARRVHRVRRPAHHRAVRGQRRAHPIGSC